MAFQNGRWMDVSSRLSRLTGHAQGEPKRPLGTAGDMMGYDQQTWWIIGGISWNIMILMVHGECHDIQGFTLESRDSMVFRYLQWNIMVLDTFDTSGNFRGIESIELTRNFREILVGYLKLIQTIQYFGWNFRYSMGLMGLSSWSITNTWGI